MDFVAVVLFIPPGLELEPRTLNVLYKCSIFHSFLSDFQGFCLGFCFRTDGKTPGVCSEAVSCSLFRQLFWSEKTLHSQVLSPVSGRGSLKVSVPT